MSASILCFDFWSYDNKYTERGTGCGGPEVKTQKCMHKYYPDMYLILYCMTCFIVLYLIYVIYYACRFEKLLRAYVDCYKMYRL